MCFPLWQATKEPTLANKSSGTLPTPLCIKKIHFLKHFSHWCPASVMPRVPNVHHFQSYIKTWGQMCFLHLHPGPFPSPKELEATAPLLLSRWLEKVSALPHCCWLSSGHWGTGGWQGRACGILTGEGISHITSPAVNVNDSQQGGITETDASSSQWW